MMKNFTMHDYPTTPKLFMMLGLLLLGAADLLDHLIAALRPDLHFLEWVACLVGAVGGQILFRADTPMRVLGGLFIGYMAGLYWGVDLALKLGLVEPNAGRTIAACLADMLGRCVEYVVRNPNRSADFVIEKGVKFIGFLGNDMIGKGFGALMDWINKKSG